MPAKAAKTAMVFTDPPYKRIAGHAQALKLFPTTESAASKPDIDLAQNPPLRSVGATD